VSVQIGSGVPAGAKKVGIGRFRKIVDENDVMELLLKGAEGSIALVEDAGASFLAPIHADLAAVMCRRGGVDSHIAIVSRGLGIPALVGVSLDSEPPEGTLVQVDGAAGSVSVQPMP
jgi:phosphoenolpyruvate-protein kinase (PTS system EI component)